MFDRDATQDEVFMALAKYVPAVSSAVGGQRLDRNVDENVDMNSVSEIDGVPRPNGWGRDSADDANPWQHSDMKDVAIFDQGHAVSLFGKLLGVDARVKVIRPFGYLASSVLVGRGVSNNPFYANPRYSPLPVCPIDDVRRSSFSCHCFVVFQSMVYDACAGPACGTMSLQEYLSACIDTETQLLRPRAGTVEDVEDFDLLDGIR